jgi:SAM-dependent methyltransferase
MTLNVSLKYGRSQAILSEKMKKYPGIGSFINKVFGYTNIGNYARSRVFIRQVNELPLRKMKDILDLGCGYGEYSFMMAKALPQARITAIDIDEKAIRTVMKAAETSGIENLKTHFGYIDELPDDQFDMIYSVDVFEHMPEKEMPFKAARKKLRQGGFLMVKMPNVTQSSVLPMSWFKDHREWLEHEHPGQIYSLKDLVQRFKDEDFNITLASRTDGKLSRLSWEIAYQMKKAGTLFQLASLPFCKLLIGLDEIMPGDKAKNGNAITVIGVKK